MWVDALDSSTQRSHQIFDRMNEWLKTEKENEQAGMGFGEGGCDEKGVLWKDRAKRQVVHFPIAYPIYCHSGGVRFS